jgi:hypothetical protein
MSSSTNEYAIEVKDLYKIIFDTRNFEISLFWQRSNYFLVLNTGVAFAFFNLKDPKYALAFAGLGLIASFLWFWVCLGSKYWQARWEHRLGDFERVHLPGLNAFSATPEQIREDVANGLAFHAHGVIKRQVYRLVLKHKPSVSYSMICLAAVFVVGWVSLIVSYLC